MLFLKLDLSCCLNHIRKFRIKDRQLCFYWNKVWNMFKVNNKDTRTTPLACWCWCKLMDFVKILGEAIFRNTSSFLCVTFSGFTKLTMTLRDKTTIFNLRWRKKMKREFWELMRVLPQFSRTYTIELAEKLVYTPQKCLANKGFVSCNKYNRGSISKIFSFK